MTISDNGPRPSTFNLEHATVHNSTFRTVAWSGRYLQVTLMSIPVGEDIGLEEHPETDQFVRVDSGRGRAEVGPSQDNLDFTAELGDGDCVIIPAGSWHNIINTGEEPLQLYTIYAPVHHAAGKVHASKDIAEADEESGNDEPPAWSVQSPHLAEDQHA